MAKMTYQEMLKHPKWQKKRLEILEVHNFMCDICGSEDKQLHVHHAYYDNQLKLWEYDSDTLRCYCNDCHAEAHQLQTALNRQIAEHDIFYISPLMTKYFGFYVEVYINLIAAEHGRDSNGMISEKMIESYKAYKRLTDG